MQQTNSLLKNINKLTTNHLEELRQVLRYHEWRYYIVQDPILGDGEYDILYHKLLEIETTHPELIEQDSPTQRVSSDIVDTSTAIRHLTPMLSLANAHNKEHLLDFQKQLYKSLSDENTAIQFAVEPKYDGGSVVLIYEKDALLSAATRGDGVMGEDITANMRALPTVPLSVQITQYGIDKIEIRGEAVIRKDKFAKVNSSRAESGLPLFANARNAATGGLRMKDPRYTAERQIEVIVYQISYIEGAAADQFSSHFERIRLLERLGFKVPQEEKALLSSIGEIHDFCRLWEEKRNTFTYEIDGMVVKVDDIALQEVIGSTTHHPKWAIAYKFQAKQATSYLEHVEYQVGRLGTITPVAKITPVPLAGVTISSVSLHNEDFIKERDLYIGDRVLVERSGDVIPYIVKSFPELRDQNAVAIEFPHSCPSCGTGLIRLDQEVAWRCPNISNCEAQIIEKLIFHVSKQAMDIDGLGRSQIERFYSAGWIQDFADIYDLPYDQIEGLGGFGEKSVSKLIEAIKKAKNNPIHRVLHSLSIHHLGQKAAKLIAAEVDSLFDLASWTEKRYTSIKDVGPVLAHNMLLFFSNPHHLQILRRLEDRGVNMNRQEEKNIEQTGLLRGKTILFTGSLASIKRHEAQELAELHGAKNLSAVSSNLDILVAGEKAGSKLKKAQDLGTVTIWSETDFLDYLSPSQS